MPTPPHKSIHQRLQYALQLRDMSMSSLAYAIGVSKSSVSDWMRGGGLNLNNAAAIALELNISLDWLLLGKGDINLFGPLHPTVTEMTLLHGLRTAGKLAFDAFLNTLQNLARPLLGEDPLSQIMALEILEKSRIAMAVVTHEGYLVELNESCLQLLGDRLDKANEVVGTHFADWLVAEDLPAAMRHMEIGMREGYNSHFPCRLQRRHHDGKAFSEVVISAIYHGTRDNGHFECALFPLD